VLAIGGYALPGVLLVVLGAAAVAAGALRSGSRSRRATLGEVQAAETLRRRSEAEARASELDLPADPIRLRHEAERVEAAELQRHQVESWLSARREHEKAWTRTATALQR